MPFMSDFFSRRLVKPQYLNNEDSNCLEHTLNLKVQSHIGNGKNWEQKILMLCVADAWIATWNSSKILHCTGE